jgi:hypothetical protein
LINCLAYIDLNPLRAGIVIRPEEYRWNSLGYHVQTNNRDNFLSTDFGLKEFNAKSKKERIRRYRRYTYEAGTVNQPEKGKVKIINGKVLEKERNREFELSRSDRFRYRTRYFTDSGIIGSKEFVSTNYQRFKHLFFSKHEKKPRSIKGLEGMEYGDAHKIISFYSALAMLYKKHAPQSPHRCPWCPASHHRSRYRRAPDIQRPCRPAKLH